jgi:uncharacterized protein (TIGR02284 family)
MSWLLAFDRVIGLRQSVLDRGKAMMNATTDIKKTLHSLLEASNDGKRGYEQAASAAKDRILRAELMQYSMQRAEFASDIQVMISNLGEEPADHGTVSGALHRAWMNLKSTASLSDRYDILAECERAEDAAVESYREAISHDLPMAVHAVVESQYDAIQRVHDRIRNLRDAAKKD